jgi:hypothetical protein
MMSRNHFGQIIAMLFIFCMVSSFAVYSEEVFDVQFLMKNVLKIHRRRTNFKGTQAEKEEIEKICKQEIAAMMTKIAETSDVAILKPLLEDAWVFYHCIHNIVEEQGKLMPELNHKIMDFIVKHGTEEVTDSRGTIAVNYARELLVQQLPEANLSPAFLEFAKELLFSGKLRFWFYFLLPEDTRKSVHPKLRELAKQLIPDGGHGGLQSMPLSATACLAFDGDEEAIAQLCLYLDHITLGGFDLRDAITICALSKQRKVIDKIIHIMKTDMREQVIGADVIPNVTGPRRAAASALSKIDKNFPPYTYKAWKMRPDPELDVCLEWLKTHEIDLKQPLYPKGLYGTWMGCFE